MSAPLAVQLPASVEVNGEDYEIRSDYRAILDVLAALSDPELRNEEKALTALDIFYVDAVQIPPRDYPKALERCVWFLNGGDEPDTKKGPKMMDWEQDFKYIVGPVNRVLGQEIRAIPYDPQTNTGGLHWFTFLSAFGEIGECVFSEIVRIRNLKAKGKKMDKTDREWYRQHRDMVDFKTKYTDADLELLKSWGLK